jgi:hypothetical protein
MTKCENCGGENKGQYYHIHYGELLDTQFSGNQNWISTNKKYKVYEHATYICDRCAASKIGCVGWVTTFILGVAVAYYGTKWMTENFTLEIGWKPILLCIIPGIFFIISAIAVAVLESRGMMPADEKTGESVAIQCLRKAFSDRDYVFWTSTEYSKLS